MKEGDLRRLRDDLRLLATRVQNQIDILQGLPTRDVESRDWHNDPLYRSIKLLGYSVQRQLRETFRRRKNDVL